MCNSLYHGLFLYSWNLSMSKGTFICIETFPFE